MKNAFKKKINEHWWKIKKKNKTRNTLEKCVAQHYVLMWLCNLSRELQLNKVCVGVDFFLTIVNQQTK